MFESEHDPALFRMNHGPSFVNSGPVFRSFINADVGPYSVGQLTGEARKLAQFCFEMMGRAGLWQYKARRQLPGYPAALEVSVIAVPNGAPLVRAWVVGVMDTSPAPTKTSPQVPVPVFYFAANGERFAIYAKKDGIYIAAPPAACELPVECSAASDVSNLHFYFWCGKKADDVVLYEHSTNAIYGPLGRKIGTAPYQIAPTSVARNSGTVLVTYMVYEPPAYDGTLDVFGLDSQAWAKLGSFEMGSSAADSHFWNLSATQAVVIQSPAIARAYGVITVDNMNVSFSYEEDNLTQEADSDSSQSETPAEYGPPQLSNPVCISWPCDTISSVTYPIEDWYMQGENTACCYTTRESGEIISNRVETEGYTRFSERVIVAPAGFYRDELVQVATGYRFDEVKSTKHETRPRRTYVRYQFQPENSYRMVCLLFDDWDLVENYVIEAERPELKLESNTAERADYSKLINLSGSGQEQNYTFGSRYSVDITTEYDVDGDEERSGESIIETQAGYSLRFFNAATGIRVLAAYDAYTENEAGEDVSYILLPGSINVPANRQLAYRNDVVVLPDNSVIEEAGIVEIEDLAYTADLCVFLRYTVGGVTKAGVFRSDFGYIELSQVDSVRLGVGFFPLVSNSKAPVGGV